MLLGHDQVLELDADVLRVHRRADGVAEDQQIDGWVIYRYSIRQSAYRRAGGVAEDQQVDGWVICAGMRQHIRQHILQHTSAYVVA
jgi:hypothetical protein